METTARKTATTTVTDIAKTSSSVQSRTTILIRNSTMAISNRAGTVVMVAATFHDSQASNRNWRTITFSRGIASEFHCMYSRSHCLARMPKKAAERLRTRLVKRALIQRADVGGVKGWESRMDDMVEFRVGGI